MLLGGPIFRAYSDPEGWVAAVAGAGYRAAYCPVGTEADDETIRAYARAAQQAGIVIAEVGAWSNPISPDETARREALELCKKALQLADEIGARCCVNLAGSRGDSREGWYDPHRANFADETFELIVATTREIIDAVQPTRTFFTLETMPWIFPDSPDSYLALMKAIDRQQFAVHLDLTNMIVTPRLFFDNAAFIRECFAKLGPHIKSCHIKDVVLRNTFSVHLEEVRPGLGVLDYRTFLQECAKLPADTPIMLEHLASEAEYAAAAEYVRAIAGKLGLSV